MIAILSNSIDRPSKITHPKSIDLSFHRSPANRIAGYERKSL
ncbi:MAG: hypothetical protein NT070_20540 [Cyanobacteria bacterium]|nr:hypothetical protein [Cyanobacteriota bacterium]